MKTPTINFLTIVQLMGLRYGAIDDDGEFWLYKNRPYIPDSTMPAADGQWTSSNHCESIATHDISLGNLEWFEKVFDLSLPEDFESVASGLSVEFIHVESDKLRVTFRDTRGTTDHSSWFNRWEWLPEGSFDMGNDDDVKIIKSFLLL